MVGLAACRLQSRSVRFRLPPCRRVLTKYSRTPCGAARVQGPLTTAKSPYRVKACSAGDRSPRHAASEPTTMLAGSPPFSADRHTPQGMMVRFEWYGERKEPPCVNARPAEPAARRPIGVVACMLSRFWPESRKRSGAKATAHRRKSRRRVASCHGCAAAK
jgi:hypothetical protein